MSTSTDRRAERAVKPQRIQLSRKAGFNLQAASMALNGLPAVNCARPGLWGNPYKPGYDDPIAGIVTEPARLVRLYRGTVMQTAFPEWRQKMRDQLVGRNLACWCALDKVCHTCVQLVIANSTSDAELYHPDTLAYERLHAIGMPQDDYFYRPLDYATVTIKAA